MWGEKILNEMLLLEESANVAFFLKQSWGGVGKRAERDGSFCMRGQCPLTRRYSMASMLYESRYTTMEDEAGLGLGLGLKLGMYDALRPYVLLLRILSTKSCG